MIPQSDTFEHNFKYHLVYEIKDYMPDSLNDEYGMVGVRDTRVKKALKEKKFLVVVAPKGSVQLNPKFVKKQYKDKMFDQEGLYPGNPMHFYPIMVPNNGKTDLDIWRFA